MAKTRQEYLPEHPFPFVGTSDFVESALDCRIPLKLFLRHQDHRVIVEERNYSISIRPPRDTLNLRITTYRGKEAGAKHYYGTLLLPQIELIDLTTRDIRSVTSEDGDVDFFTSDQFSFPRKIELRRILNAFEAPRYNPDLSLTAGQAVHGFDTAEEIVPHAQEVVAKYFPGFRLIT
jgi:hypothetical protein